MYNVTSVKEANAIIGALEDIKNAIPPSNSVPDVTSADNKKVLQAYYGDASSKGYGWASLDGMLANIGEPSNGDVMTYNSETEKAEWQTPQGGGGGLPSISDSDNGKFLQATYDDKSGTSFASWVTPSGVGYVFLDKTEFNYDDKSGEYSINYGATDKYVLSVIATENYGDGKQKVISEYSLDSHYSMLSIDSTTFSALSDYAYIALYYMI